MTDLPVLDPEELQSLADVFAAELGGIGWTGLKQVIMGAFIGNVQRVSVPVQADNKMPRHGLCYYTSIDGTQVGTAINAGRVPNRYGKRVIIGYPPTDKSTLHFYDQASENEQAASTIERGVAKHRDGHSLRNLAHNGGGFGGKVGEDYTISDLRQIWNLSIQPWEDLVVYIPEGWLVFDGVKVYWPGGFKDFTASMPATAGQAQWALLEIDNTGTLHTTLGTAHVYSAPASSLDTYMPTFTVGYFQVGAVYLRNADTELNVSHIWPITAFGTVNSGGGTGTVVPGTFEARLSLTSGTPVTTSDVSAATDVYLSAYAGELISIYDGSSDWDYYRLNSVIDIPVTDTQNGDTTNGSAVITNLTDTSRLIAGMEVTGAGIVANSVISSVDSATQITMNNNATATATVAITFKIPASTIVDIFVIDDGGSLALRYGPLWTNSGLGTSARATALTTQDGVYVLTGSVTWRYAGTLYTTAVAGQAEDSEDYRGLWNYYNRVLRLLNKVDATSHTYATATYRYWNNDSTNRMFFVIGVLEDTTVVSISGRITPTSALGQIAIYHNALTTQLTFYGHAINNEAVAAGTAEVYTSSLGANSYDAAEYSGGTNTTFSFFLMTAFIRG